MIGILDQSWSVSLKFLGIGATFDWKGNKFYLKFIRKVCKISFSEFSKLLFDIHFAFTKIAGIN